MISERIKNLRAQMALSEVDAWIITGTDPHQSEYVAPRWRTREFISGFSGSAGTVVITKDEALLWVDSRYFLQGAQQIEGTEYKLMKLDTEGTPDPWKWLSENMQILLAEAMCKDITRDEVHRLVDSIYDYYQGKTKEE